MPSQAVARARFVDTFFLLPGGILLRLSAMAARQRRPTGIHARYE